MLQNNHGILQQNHTLSPLINDLPSLCENQQQAREQTGAASKMARSAEIPGRSRYSSGYCPVDIEQRET